MARASFEAQTLNAPQRVRPSAAGERSAEGMTDVNLGDGRRRRQPEPLRSELLLRRGRWTGAVARPRRRPDPSRVGGHVLDAGEAGSEARRGHRRRRALPWSCPQRSPHFAI